MKVNFSCMKIFQMYIFLWILFRFCLTKIHSNVLEIEYLPTILHSDQLNLTVLYQCSLGTKQQIFLRIFLEDKTPLTVFRRTWFCYGSSSIQKLSIPLKLHRSIAYATDIQTNSYSWPVETGRLSIVMYGDENQIVKQVEYNVRFLPVEQRPMIRSFRWSPWKEKDICLKEPEIVRIVDYPIVLTNEYSFGKYFVFPRLNDLHLRWENRNQFIRAKFSIVFWIYLEEYCMNDNLCSILQHVTFNKTHLTPELFINRQGHLVVHLFGNSSDIKVEQARTLASIPKQDWCRIVFVVYENQWNVTINCMKTWETNITAIYRASIFFSYSDELGTFIVGGSEKAPSIRGFLAQMDFYRRTILTSKHLPKKLHLSVPAYLPSVISQSNQCLPYHLLFRQCQEEVNRINKRIQRKKTCSSLLPFHLKKFKYPQCSIIRTWKRYPKEIAYRIFRALYRQTINSIEDIGKKIFELIDNLLEIEDDPDIICQFVPKWLEQAVCYNHPAAYSFLATFYHFGLCNFKVNSTRVVELLLNGGLLKDRLSLLALGHRHFYGFDGISQDYDAASLYYREMAEIAKKEYYNPKPGEIVMEYIRLTDENLISQLTFDKSDTFDWLKDQARRGVASAQQKLGALFYQGSHGLSRNIQIAAEYFRLAASQSDPYATLMYGSMLLRGQGVPQNITEAIRYLEEAAKHGLVDALIALGYYAYNTEKNYTKAVRYWQECYNQSQNVFCAHNLGHLWTHGHYPPEYKEDHRKAWNYYAYAAQKGQIDSKIMVAYYNTIADHPIIPRNSRVSAIWSKSVGDASTIVGLISRRALTAYRDNRWHTAYLFYLQTALVGIELGYFNGGYLCHELKVNYQSTIDCIEQLLEKSLLIREIYPYHENYDLIILAEYYLLKRNEINKTIELYVRLFRNGDPRGLYELAQLEEQIDQLIPLNVWKSMGIEFNQDIQMNKYQRLKIVYEYCQSLTIPRSSESYLPCTLIYFKISTIILFSQLRTIKILITILIFIIAICLGILF